MAMWDNPYQMKKAQPSQPNQPVSHPANPYAPQPQPAQPAAAMGPDPQQMEMEKRMAQLKEQQLREKFRYDLQKHQADQQQKQWQTMQAAYQAKMQQAAPPPAQPSFLGQWNQLQQTRHALGGQATTHLENPFNQLYNQISSGKKTSGSGSNAAFSRSLSMPSGSLSPSVRF